MFDSVLNTSLVDTVGYQNMNHNLLCCLSYKGNVWCPSKSVLSLTLSATLIREWLLKQLHVFQTNQLSVYHSKCHILYDNRYSNNVSIWAHIYCPLRLSKFEMLIWMIFLFSGNIYQMKTSWSVSGGSEFTESPWRVKVEAKTVVSDAIKIAI